MLPDLLMNFLWHCIITSTNIILWFVYWNNLPPPCVINKPLGFVSLRDPFFSHTLVEINLGSGMSVAHFCISSSVAPRFILRMSGLHLIVWSLYISALKVFFKRWVWDLHSCPGEAEDDHWLLFWGFTSQL